MNRIVYLSLLSNQNYSGVSLKLENSKLDSSGGFNFSRLYNQIAKFAFDDHIFQPRLKELRLRPVWSSTSDFNQVESNLIKSDPEVFWSSKGSPDTKRSEFLIFQ